MAFIYHMRSGPAPGIDYKVTYEPVDLEEVRRLARWELGELLNQDEAGIADRVMDAVFYILSER